MTPPPARPMVRVAHPFRGGGANRPTPSPGTPGEGRGEGRARNDKHLCLPARFAPPLLKQWATLAFYIVTALLAPSTTAAEPFDWRPDTPAHQGLSPDKLTHLRDALVKLNTKSLLVIRHDRVVLEWYADGHAADKPHSTASLAKSLVGGMSLAVAMHDARLRPADPATRFVPQWKADPPKSKITIAQLASHTSGLEDAEQDVTPHDKLPGWKGAFWRRDPDPFTISRDQCPAVFEPGAKAAYSNPGMAMLAYAVTAAIAEGPQKDLRSLLRDRVLRPIGVKDSEWSIGYGKTYTVDNLPLVANWGGANFTARATARVGRLMLREGDWDGTQLIASKTIRECLDYRTPADLKDWKGPAGPRPVLGWYTNVDKSWPAAPRDAFCGAGAGHQVLLVIPSLDLIVVRNGGQIPGRGDFWQAVEREIVNPVVAAVTDPPNRPSEVIRRVQFDPENTILRQAKDSDNWPLTWADDGALYTAYGDGRGFAPPVEKKLSLGLAKIDGAPPTFTGTNLRSDSAERVGDGAKGPKASGLLMVDGTLYMWVRNTANATLAWSTDRGQTWTWGFTFTESFGCPTFLNFGPNYSGARDDYVYVYSQDGPSAYETYDNVLLARVPKTRIRDRDAYEYFLNLDPAGQPTWSAKIADRGPVFRYPAHCERLDAVYNKGLNRYLLAVSYGHGRGWGLYDAPHPWGPWSTAFSTTDWGLGETHGYRLPTKWISDDGKRMWLVFSGRGENDAFCVRGMRLNTYP